MQAIITVGISCSGKSTLARSFVEQGWYEVNRDFIRFNMVCPGNDFRNYKFSKANESEVTKIQGQMIMEAHARGENIIVSDTNLNPSLRNGLKTKLEDLGYDVEIRGMPISVTEAWKRDTYRQNGVGHSTIYQQHLKWNEYIGRKTYKSNWRLPVAIIVDIDGTVAEMNDRGPFEWSKVGQDSPRLFILDMVYNYYLQGYKILFVSGRSDECRTETEQWLTSYYSGKYDGLFMRKAGDYRKDDEVKEEIFWTNLAPHYNIQAAIDDRPQVLRLWYDLQIKNVICVGNPFIEF